MPPVLAKVETLRPGDRVYLPRGSADGCPVESVDLYDDGDYVVVYRTGRSSRARFGDVVLTTQDVLASLAPLRRGDRVKCSRTSGRAAATEARTAPR